MSLALISAQHNIQCCGSILLHCVEAFVRGAAWTGSWLVGGDWEKERSNERRLKFCVPTLITENGNAQSVEFAYASTKRSQHPTYSLRTVPYV